MHSPPPPPPSVAERERAGHDSVRSRLGPRCGAGGSRHHLGLSSRSLSLLLSRVSTSDCSGGTSHRTTLRIRAAPELQPHGPLAPESQDLHGTRTGERVSVEHATCLLGWLLSRRQPGTLLLDPQHEPTACHWQCHRDTQSTQAGGQTLGRSGSITETHK